MTYCVLIKIIGITVNGLHSFDRLSVLIIIVDFPIFGVPAGDLHQGFAGYDHTVITDHISPSSEIDRTGLHGSVGSEEILFPVYRFGADGHDPVGSEKILLPIQGEPSGFHGTCFGIKIIPVRSDLYKAGASLSVRTEVILNASGSNPHILLHGSVFIKSIKCIADLRGHIRECISILRSIRFIEIIRLASIIDEARLLGSRGFIEEILLSVRGCVKILYFITIYIVIGNPVEGLKPG